MNYAETFTRCQRPSASASALMLTQGVRAFVVASGRAAGLRSRSSPSRSWTQSVVPASARPRHYGVYPSFYVKPIYQPDEKRKLEESGELAKLAFVPILPPENDHNASVWHDPLVSKFINRLMTHSDKVVGRELIEKTFQKIKKIQLEKYYNAKDEAERAAIIINPYEIFHRAINNTKPFLETTTVKRGGSNYQVPVPVREKRQTFLAIRWLIDAGNDKDRNMRFYDKMALEFLDAANNVGRVVKRKQDLHKLCEANRAYAHYRWG